MTNDEKKREVYYRFKSELQPDKQKKGYICPVCGNGSGSDGDGITENRRSPNHYTCWRGCFTNADPFEIIAIMSGLEPNSGEAMRAAYAKYGITPDTEPTPKAQEVQTAQEVQDAPIDYTDYYNRMAENITAAEAQRYLSIRGISTETAQRLRWGFDPQWRSPAALRAGKKPPASARLIIPTSRSSYLARATSAETEKQYQKMKEGAVSLYNLRSLYNTKGRACFVVEGEIDAASVLEVGGEAVALGSTSMAEKFIAACKEKPTGNLLLIALDDDEAGQKATGYLLDALKKLRITAAAVDIRCGKNDPNDALTADREAFKKAVEAAEAAQQPGRRMIDHFLQAVQTQRYEPMPTGLQVSDEMIGGGFLRQTIVMMGAAPGMGKSYFAQQLFEGMAQQGHNVLYFNLEMSREQMLARSFSRIARQRENGRMTAIDVLQGYKWTDYQRGIMEKTADFYGQHIAPHMAYNPGGGTAQLDEILTQMEVAAKRATNAGKEAPLVVLDYLHLLRGGEREDAQTTIKRAVDAFKDYAMRYNSVVFVILAFNRASNSSGKATQESARDSSGIEYGADLMLGLNYAKLEEGEVDTELVQKIREEEKNREQIPYKLKVLKNRLQGGCGTADIEFSGRYGLFFSSKDKATQMSALDTDLPFYGEPAPRRL